jgi:hypothetical protein
MADNGPPVHLDHVTWRVCDGEDDTTGKSLLTTAIENADKCEVIDQLALIRQGVSNGPVDVTNTEGGQ